MKRPAILCAAVAVTLLGACAGPAFVRRDAAPPPPRDPARIAGAVTPGRSTRDDVRAALGAATVARFDSGYEVWVYRFGAPADGERRRDGERVAPGEFVVLFAPSGVVTRTRLRLAPAQPR